MAELVSYCFTTEPPKVLRTLRYSPTGELYFPVRASFASHLSPGDRAISLKRDTSTGVSGLMVYPFKYVCAPGSRIALPPAARRACLSAVAEAKPVDDAFEEAHR